LIEDETYVSPWLSPPLERGRLIEKYFGAKGDNSPVVDLVENGVATSIKSLDLRATTYQSSSKLESKLKGYINKVAKYDGGKFGDGRVTVGTDFTERSLLLALPEGSATQAQQQVLSKMFSYAMNNGVRLDVRFVK
jgi:filamentous hemagglutinin